MDPLSITASTITLIQATGAVATALGKFANGLKTVDSRIIGLNDELSYLTGFLIAIENTLDGCQRLDLDLAEDGLWHQSEIALVNCQTTLNELRILVNKINGSSKSRGFAWKTRVVVDLSIHGEALAGYRDKIHQSNAALQTILHAITVKLSLKNKASQNQIIKELEKLKASIYETLHTSSRPVGGFYRTGDMQQTEQRLTRNLRSLAVEAQNFYTAASSTAGTVRSGDSDACWQLPPDPQLSIMGDFPAFSRARVEQYLEHSKDFLSLETEPSTPSTKYNSFSLSSSTVLPQPESNTCHHEKRPEAVNKMTLVPEEEDDDDDDGELEQAFLNALKELAISNIKAMDYSKAITFLQEAMTQEDSCKTENSKDQLRIQLALCYFFQGNWRQAEPLVNELLESKGNDDLIVCNLLHTLALGHLAEYSLQEALKICKTALLGKKKYCKKNDLQQEEYNETLGLFATIFDVSGDYIRAEVFYREIPEDFVYHHPINASEFLKAKKELLMTVLGDNVPDFKSHRPPTDVIELQGSLDSTQTTVGFESQTYPVLPCSDWRLKVSRHEKYELDTSKEAVVGILESPIDGDDEASPVEHQESPIRKHFSRFFGRRNHLATDAEEIYLNRIDHDTSDSSPASPSSSKLQWLTRGKMFRGRRRKLDKDLRGVTNPTRFRPAELSDTGLIPMTVASRHSDQGAIPRELSGTGRSPLTGFYNQQSNSTLNSRQSLNVNANGSRHLLLDVENRSEVNATDAQVASETNSSTDVYSKPMEADLGGSEIASTSLGIILDVGERFITSGLPRRAHILGPLPKIPAGLGNVLDQITTVMASLENVQSRGDAEPALISLLPDLKSMSHDRVFVKDVERVLRTLAQERQDKEASDSDSGYESALKIGNDRNRSSRVSVSPVGSASISKPKIARANSWVQGSEAAFTVVSTKDPQTSDTTNGSMAGSKYTGEDLSALETGFHAITTDQVIESGVKTTSTNYPVSEARNPAKMVEELFFNFFKPGAEIFQPIPNHKPEELNRISKFQEVPNTEDFKPQPSCQASNRNAHDFEARIAVNLLVELEDTSDTRIRTLRRKKLEKKMIRSTPWSISRKWGQSLSGEGEDLDAGIGWLMPYMPCE